MTLLDTLCREHGCTLVVVTHDDRVSAMADRTLHMIDGCLEATLSLHVPGGNKPL